MNFQHEIDSEIKGKTLYFLGDQLPPDWYAGFKAWLQLAEAGNAFAQFNVGRCYLSGNGIDQDFNLAKEWLFKAFKQGEPRSSFDLFKLHSDKSSYFFDQEQANFFLSESERLGEPRALGYLKKRNDEREMEREKLEASQRREEGEKLRKRLAPVFEEFKDAFSRRNSGKMIKCIDNAREIDANCANHLAGLSKLGFYTHGDNHTSSTTNSGPIIINGSSHTVSFKNNYFDFWVILKNPTEFPVSVSRYLGIPPGSEIRVEVGNFYKENMPSSTKIVTEGALSNGESFSFELPFGLKFPMVYDAELLRKVFFGSVVLLGLLYLIK